MGFLWDPQVLLATQFSPSNMEEKKKITERQQEITAGIDSDGVPGVWLLPCPTATRRCSIGEEGLLVAFHRIEM